MPNPIKAMMIVFVGLLALFAAQDQAVTQGEMPGLKLETKIPIGNVNGRIDHMALDLVRQPIEAAVHRPLSP